MKDIMEQITAEEIKERIKENLSRAKSNLTPVMISNAEPTQKKNNGDLLKYLLSLKDNDVFLREAYGKILDRMPDAHGYKHYMDELNEGVPQKAILYRLINSPEARAKKVELKFRQKLTFYAFISRLRPIIKKVPLASTVFFWLYRLLRLPSRFHQLSQHFKVVLSEIGGLQAQESSHSSAIEGLQSQLASLSSAGGKRVSSDWAKFYSREITNEDMAKNIEHHRYFIDLISDWANKTSYTHTPKLVEIGVGTATMSIYLSKRYFEVVGLDLDPLIVAKAIETNNRLGGHAKFIAMDAYDLSKFFKENAFDIAFSQGTLEHFDNENLKQILEAQLAIAKYVILSVPSVNWPQEDFGDERKMTVEEWKKLLNDFELKIEHISYYQEGDLHIAIVISKA